MRRWLLRCLLCLLVLSPPVALANQAAEQTDADKAWADAKNAAERGPQDIALAGQAVLHLPAGKVFIPQPQAAVLLRVMGNPGNYADLQGLVLSQQRGSDWFVIVSYEASGHIKDDDAKDWNTDAMLKLARADTQAANALREKAGAPALEIIGWAQRPSYKPAAHRLLWAMVSRPKGAAANAVQGVNYNACALGRAGYLSLNLVTELSELPADQPEVAGLLAAMSFNPGQRYADFNPSTDAIAKDGLAALVLGAGAGAGTKKLGPLALGLASLASFARLAVPALLGVLVLVLSGLCVGVVKWRRCRKAKIATPLLLPAPAPEPEPAESTQPALPGEPPHC